MPYISADKTKLIREKIKTEFKETGLKFSVTTENHSTINIDLMESPYDISECTNRGVNHFYIDKSDIPDGLKLIFKHILKIIDSIHEQKEVTYDGDYGSVPNYYINLGIGKWNKPYKQIKNKGEKL